MTTTPDRWLVLAMDGDSLIVDTLPSPAVAVYRHTGPIPDGLAEIVKLANVAAARPAPRPRKGRGATSPRPYTRPRAGLQEDILGALLQLGEPASREDVATVIDHPLDPTGACLSALWTRGWVEWVDSGKSAIGRSIRLYSITPAGTEHYVTVRPEMTS